MKNIFFTSDTHFYHTNIIKYCNRPFSSVEEMNQKLIENWNNTVSEHDTIFHLGDFMFKKNWEEILSQLNGHIHLILGNHDCTTFKNKYRQYFDSVQEQLTIKVEDIKLILTHFPLLCYHGSTENESNIWNIHGHVHLCKNNNGNYERIKLTCPTQYDVGVDFNNYTPISFNNLKHIINTQIKNNINQTYWINENL